jgi:hypothetical protein
MSVGAVYRPETTHLLHARRDVELILTGRRQPDADETYGEIVIDGGQPGPIDGASPHGAERLAISQEPHSFN